MQFVGGKNFDYYLGIIILPILVISIAEIVMVIYEVPIYFFWAINIITFLYIAWAIYLRRHDSFTEAGTAAVMLGVVVGLFLAIFRIIYFHKVYLVFNLIAEPIRTGILGLAIVWLIHLIISLFKKGPSQKPKNTYLSSLIKKKR